MMRIKLGGLLIGLMGISLSGESCVLLDWG
jgi:hypothetical protein